MAPNRSTAVMARRVEPRDSLDDFPTPPWAVRAFLRTAGDMVPLRGMTVWEPACGRGHMARTLAEFNPQPILHSDIHDYGIGAVVHDFLGGIELVSSDQHPDWIITNPPFRLAEAFALHALKRTRKGVALLVRTAFLEGNRRYERLFGPHMPAAVYQYVERVPMVKGRLDPRASTATSYCWIVWRHRWPVATELAWIPPCRKQLERPGDYD